MARSNDPKILTLRAWAEENYEKGADVMVECWPDSEFQEVLDRYNGDVEKAKKYLKRIASVFYDQEMDAINSAF